MTSSIVETAVTQLAELLLPLRSATSSAGAAALLRNVGCTAAVASIPRGVADIGKPLDDLFKALSTPVDPNDETARYARLVQIGVQIANVIAAVSKLADTVSGVARTGGGGSLQPSKLAKRLVDFLVISYFERRQPDLMSVLTILGIAGTKVQDGLPVRELHVDRIGKWLEDPGDQLNLLLGWRTNLNTSLVLSMLQYVARKAGLPAGFYPQDRGLNASIGETRSDAVSLRVPLVQIVDWPRSAGEIGVHLGEAPARGGDGKGLFLMPYAAGATALSVPLSSTLTLKFEASAGLSSTPAVIVRPSGRVQVLVDGVSGSGQENQGSLRISLTSAPEGDGLLLFGTPNGPRLSLGKVGIAGAFEQLGDQGEAQIELRLERCKVVLSDGRMDSFVSRLLGGETVQAEFELIIGFSTLRGLYFGGSGRLEIEIPVHKNIGPLSILSIQVGIGVDESRVLTTLAASLSAEVGPISASVKGIGIGLPMRFVDGGNGDLGPLAFEGIKFVPPTGAGLVVDAGGITGGGFLDFDADEGRYDGAMQLRFSDIGLYAIGLINTKMPDGKPGFALLISIGVNFNPPIQLSFGFVLSAVGGLLAVNRRMDVDFLRSGLRNGTLDSILFPENVVRDAPIIISNMRSAFPIEEGRYIVGPMVTIGWGSPPLVTADIGIFIEIPSPIVIALLGQVAAALPKKEDAVVELHIDVLGELNPSRKKLAIDASLHHSKLLTYPLTGGAALRWLWGDKPIFLMSMGGFHPQFKDKPSDIDLRRLKLSVRSGGSFDLRCEAYQALTSNSLQFGARLELHAEAGDASVDGEMSFDALFIFSPFSFDVDIRGGVTAEAYGCRVSVRLRLSLSGPTPWDARGRASFEVCGFDVDVNFHKTWGRDDKARLPAKDPLPPLLAALNRAASWGSALPPGSVMVEALRLPAPTAGTAPAPADAAPAPAPAEPAPTLLAHPMGALEVRQNVLPLNVKLERFANAPIKGNNKFRLYVPAGTSTLEDQPVDEYFACAQFEDLSDSQKLKKPSFEKMEGGISLGSEQPGAHGAAVKHEIEYECILLGKDGTLQPGPKRATLNWTRGQRIVRGAAARRSAHRASGLRGFERPGVKPKITVDDESYVLAYKGTAGRLAAVAGTRKDRGMTHMEAERALEQYVRNNPADAGKLAVVPAYEAA